MAAVKTVDEYIARHEPWQELLLQLRDILLSTELEETVKWGAPVYTIDGKNVVGIGAFKSYAGLWFFQGVFLKDPQQKLVNAQEGTTKALRQWRFDTVEDMDEKLVKAYVLEAIENQKQGKEIKPEKKKTTLPDELKEALRKDTQLKKAFDAFTPGKQREFAEYIGSAKQEKTRLSRLEKVQPMILAGKGLNDKYR